ncbi:MAG: hypothetical protein M3O86_02970 [Actinomycetota bacterium]|nr:hypothetical protein [Actinomycetota bacterium]
MRKLLVALVTAALVSGPLAAAAIADPIDTVEDLNCRLQDKLGIENVKECRLS